jgi:hypothetical protein
VDARAQSLLRAFVEKLGMDDGDVVTRSAPDQGIVELERNGTPVLLSFREGELLDLLRGAGRDGSGAWGQRLPDEEAAARFLATCLDESLATDDPHRTGWWMYEDRRFVPAPPWEAAQGRRRRRG